MQQSSQQNDENARNDENEHRFDDETAPIFTPIPHPFDLCITYVPQTLILRPKLIHNPTLDHQPAPFSLSSFAHFPVILRKRSAVAGSIDYIWKSWTLFGARATTRRMTRLVAKDDSPLVLELACQRVDGASFAERKTAAQELTSLKARSTP